MRDIVVDVAIVGAGTAGLGAQREVEKAGKSYVLVEAGPYGTTCARVGCMPSKLLLAAADAARAVAQAPIFGVRAEGVRVDGRAVMKRVREERDRFTADVVRSTEAIAADRRLRGTARFVARDVIQVDDRARVKARAFVIATGSRPWIPPPFDAIAGHVDTSDDIFEWSDLPASVAVVGTGVIALELGQALQRLGVRVTFVNPLDELGPFSDPVCIAKAREVFASELDLELGVEDLAAEPAGGGVRLRWKRDGRAHERLFEKVLVAAGRRPNLEALDLAKTGLTLDRRGRPAWNPRTCQCERSPIFLAGDASGHRPLLHEASDEGHIAGSNAASYPEVTAHVRRTPIAIAFTDPQMAIVGRYYRDLGEGVAIGEASFDDQGRARVMARNRGVIRIYADCASAQLIGAEMLGPNVEHLAHLVAWAVQRAMTVQDCLSMPFYHPVVEEGLRTALRALAKDLAVAGACRGEDLAECPGQ